MNKGKTKKLGKGHKIVLSKSININSKKNSENDAASPNNQIIDDSTVSPQQMDTSNVAPKNTNNNGVIAKSAPKLFSDMSNEENTNNPLNADNTVKPTPAEITMLQQYWQHVRGNPYDFDGWTTLLTHVETMNSIEQARAAFDSFLPLYPYCFAYWKKLSTIEEKFNGVESGLGVLFVGVECVPACIDLWLPLFNQFKDYIIKKDMPESLIKEFYEYALSKVAISWHSSSVWDAIVEYEMSKKNLSTVFSLYRRLLNIPTKLYNKHWDYVVALVRDHDPQALLSKSEYVKLRKEACKDLKIKYIPPISMSEEISIVPKPADEKITTCIKEKMLAPLIKMHEENEKEVDKRWKMEEKIKRPYFHVKPLDKKQLKNWKDYVEYELGQGDPFRIISLFERCLVSCALYEEFWCKYGFYMEGHAKNVAQGKYKEILAKEREADNPVFSVDLDAEVVDYSEVKVKIEKVDDLFDANTPTVDIPDCKKDIQSKLIDIKCEKNNDSNKGVNDVQVMSDNNVNIVGPVIKSETQAGDKTEGSSTNKNSKDLNSNGSAPNDSETSNYQTDSSNGQIDSNNKNVDSSEIIGDNDSNSGAKNKDNQVCADEQSGDINMKDLSDSNTNNKVTNTNVDIDITDDNTREQSNTNIDITQEQSSLNTLSELKPTLCKGVSIGGRVLTCPPLTRAWVLTGVTWEDVRHVYRRAIWIHCPSKPKLLMQWAEFEESQGNIQTARDLLNSAISKHPKLLKPRMQLIEMERRANNNERVEELYQDAFKNIKEADNKSWLAIRYARFLFKILQDPEKALAVLRKALKRDRGNIHLYHHVFDICYQRQPVDSQGVLASVKLALASKDLSTDIKVQFSRKQVEFLREHGSMIDLKNAQEEYESLKEAYDTELEEIRKKKEEEEKNRIDEELKKAKEEKIIDDKDKKEEGKSDKPETTNDQTSVANTSAVTTTVTSTPPIPPFHSSGPPPQMGLPPSMNTPPMVPPFNNPGVPFQNQPPPNLNFGPPNRPPMPMHMQPGGGPNFPPAGGFPPNQPHQIRPGFPPGPGGPPMVGPGGPPMPGPMQGPPNSQENPNQQFSQPFFGNDGTIQYNPMEGYGYGHSDPNQQLPTADEIVRQGNKEQYHKVAPSWELNQSQPYGYGVDRDELKKQTVDSYSNYDKLLTKGYPDAMKDKIVLKDDTYNMKINIDHLRSNRPTGVAPAGPSPLKPPPLPPFTLGGGPGGIRFDGPPNQLPPPNMPPFSAANERPPFNPQQNHPPNSGPMFNNMQDGPFNNRFKRPGPEMNQGGPPMKMPFQPSEPQHRPEFNSNYNEFNQSQGPPSNRGNLGTYTSLSELLHGPGSSENAGRGAGPNPPYNDMNRDRLQELKKRLLEENAPTPIPKAITDAKSSLACVNVPEWLVREGGELKLSETENGISQIRYWPKFMTPEGCNVTFRVLRKESVKWHQRQIKVNGNWQNLPRLISWIGPCHYEFSGMQMEKNANWPPEVVDLLHRLIKCTNHQYNCTLLNLYRNGHDYMPWQSDNHPALRENPPVASVSLGINRWFELRRKDKSSFIRFPLFPGSLLLMEGATQTDWEYGIPKQPNVAGERINLTFRNMYMIEGLTI